VTAPGGAVRTALCRRAQSWTALLARDPPGAGAAWVHGAASLRARCGFGPSPRGCRRIWCGAPHAAKCRALRERLGLGAAL